MTRLRSLLLLALCACTPASPPPRVTPAAIPAAGLAQRVVLVSFDGLGADALAVQPDLPSFAALARDGASARIIPVNPTATSSAHVSILTGAQPQIHGVVANRFHIAGTPPDEIARGLETDIDAETLIESARRQGKRVGSASFPTVDARTPRRSSDFGFSWTPSVTNPKMIHLERADFHREWVPPTWTRRTPRHTSYSAVMRARLDWNVPEKARGDVDVVAYDTTNDGTENYDLLLIEAGEREITPDAHGWFALSAETSEGLYGSWSRFVSSDPALKDVSIYWGAISRTDGWPESYRAMLDREIGFWPGVPDEHRNVDAQTFTDQMNRLADFLTAAEVLTMQQIPFDLLLAYQPQIDTASHTRFDDPAVIHAAFVAADRAIGALRSGAERAGATLVVTGDHGLAPVDTEIHMNRLLAGSVFRAFASGNVAHLYGAGNADAVIRQLEATGLFEQITKKDARSHRNSGDVVAYSYPHVLLTPSTEEPAIGKPASKANHGALNVHRELHTVLFAVGPGTPKGTLGEFSQTRIARFVSRLLGIQPPSAAE